VGEPGGSPTSKRRRLPKEPHPQAMRTGGVEPPQSVTLRLQRSELAGAQRPRKRAADRDRTGTAGITTPGAAGYTTAAMSDVGYPWFPHGPLLLVCAPVIGVWPPGRQNRPPASSACAWFTDRGLSRRRRATTVCVLRTSGYHIDSAGGIRTHDLELMRLAGTATPLPRKSGWLESNQRSPAPKAGGVASLPYSQVSIESTTVESNHAVPPYQSGASPAGPSSSLAGRSRTPVHHGRNVALSTELRRERRSRRESNPPHPGDSQAASPDAPESIRWGNPCSPTSPLLRSAHGTGRGWPPGRRSRPPATTLDARIDRRQTTDP
jgi:hypothetical protein